MNVGMSLLCGEPVSKARLRMKVAKKLSINRGWVSNIALDFFVGRNPVVH